ncbi:hypothetical protein ACFV4P_02455 [Kitasatospora sp. NPDC059795]|uniref:hypothetical protein n=1 Tax=Kitasatospora sp. NPDC059795 TaxID=3346949 RepID=UPI00365BFB29
MGKKPRRRRRADTPTVDRAVHVPRAAADPFIYEVKGSTGHSSALATAIWQNVPAGKSNTVAAVTAALGAEGRRLFDLPDTASPQSPTLDGPRARKVRNDQASHLLFRYALSVEQYRQDDPDHSDVAELKALVARWRPAAQAKALEAEAILKLGFDAAALVDRMEEAGVETASVSTQEIIDAVRAARGGAE